MLAMRVPASRFYISAQLCCLGLLFAAPGGILGRLVLGNVPGWSFQSQRLKPQGSTQPAHE